jgi:hypothetical protein
MVTPAQFTFPAFAAANVVFALWAGWGSKDSDPTVSRWREHTGSVGLLCASASHLCYIVFVLPIIFRWIASYPGSPVSKHMAHAGGALSLSAIALAPFGSGFRRLVAAVVGFSAGLLWAITLAFMNVL